MNEYLIAYWNNVVTNNDIVYYLGDFGLASKCVLQNILSKLKRKKIILIRGNHDKSEQFMLDVGFDEVHKYMEFKKDKLNLFLSHVPMYTPYHDACICGHSHQAFKVNGNIINVGVDNFAFKPVAYEDILEIMKREQFGKENFKPMHIPTEGE